MRTAPVLLAAILIMNGHAFAQTGTGSVSYSTPDRGGMVIETGGGTNPIVVGYGLVQPVSSTAPAGVAILDLRQNSVLVSEAGVPAMAPILSGRIYAEVGGPANTGIAFVNPTGAQVTISFNFTDTGGNDFPQSSFVLDPGTQIAKFLSEAPFSLGTFTGTLTFTTSSAQVGVVALRTLVNERGEFLVTPETVTPLPDNFSTSTIVLGHFADGGGWRTQLILLNTSDVAISGTVQFLDEGTPTTAGAPVRLNVNGVVAASFPYSIRPRASVKLETMGAVTAATRVGSVQITPGAGSPGPSASAFFSFSRNSVTVARATVQAQTAGVVLRTYVEVSSAAAIPGAIQSGIAITNNSSTSATVNFELTGLDGINTGVTALLVVPPSGHVSKFVHEIFPTLTLPFKGILRASSSNLTVMVSLRARYNERGDLLVTTMPVTNEATPSSTANLLFPQIVDQGGYTTQFILFSGIAGQRTTGVLAFFGQNGRLSLTAISNVAFSGITISGATITWTTAAPADSQVDYGTTSSYGQSSRLDSSLVTSHSVALSGLSPGTTYHFRVRSADASGNSATSADAVFTTGVAGTTPPVITNVTGSGTGPGATITWTTDKPSDSQVDYGTTSGYGQTTLNGSLVTSHSVPLSGLSAGTTYHFRVRSKDSAGNTASSSDFTFTTPASSFSTGWTIPNTILRSVRPPDNFGLSTLDIRHMSFVQHRR